MGLTTLPPPPPVLGVVDSLLSIIDVCRVLPLEGGKGGADDAPPVALLGDPPPSPLPALLSNISLNSNERRVALLGRFLALKVLGEEDPSR